MTIHTTNSIQYNFNVLKQEEPVIRKAIIKRGSKYLRWIMLGCARANIRTNKKSKITQFYTRLAKIKVIKNCLLDYEREKKVQSS